MAFTRKQATSGQAPAAREAGPPTAPMPGVATGAAELTPAEQAQTVRKIALRLIPVLGLAYFINSVDRSNISLAALTMNKALGLNSAAFGLASGLFFIGYFVFEVPSNIALYKVGPRKWITRIMISWGLVTVATALVQGATSLYVLRILLGVAEAGFYPGVLLFLTFWFPARYRSRMLAFFVMGGSLSGVFGSPITGLILAHSDGFLGMSGWRAMFVLEGIPAILVGVLSMVILRDKPEDARWLTDRERSWLVGTLAAERASVRSNHRGSGSYGMLKDWRVALLSFIYFCKCCGQYALTFFLPQMIVAFQSSIHQHFSVVQISVITAIPAVFAICVSIPWAIHSDRTNERVWHAAIPMFVSAVGICVAVLVHQPLVALAALCVVSIGIGTQSQSFFQIPSTFLTGVAAAGGLAMINAVGNLGGFFAPYVTGWLKDTTGNFTIACFVMGAVMCLAGITTVLFPRLVNARTQMDAKVTVHA